MANISVYRQLTARHQGDSLPELAAPVHGGGATVEVAEPPESGTSAPGARRWPVRWHVGRHSGHGHIEFAAVGPETLLVEVALAAGRWLPGWDRRRLEQLADTLAAAVRETIEGPLQPDPSHAASGAPVRSAPRRTAAPAPPWRRRLAPPIVAGVTALALATTGGFVLMNRLSQTHAVGVDESLAHFREATGAVSEPAPAMTAPPAAPSHTPTAAPPAAADPAGTAATAAPAPEPEASAASAPVAAPAAAPLPATGSDQRRRPEPGVYVYATDGTEEVSVPNGHRRYPEETTITVLHAGCGVVFRWEPLRERWDEYEICGGPERPQLHRISMYHQFYGQRQRQDTRCVGAAMAPSDEVGTRWTTTCESDDTTILTTGELLGHPVVDVGGTAVEAEEVVLRSRMDGAIRGTRTAHRWSEHATGLLLREIVTVEADVDGFPGSFRYREQYEIVLTSLVPRR